MEGYVRRAILISHQVDVKPKQITRDKENHILMINLFPENM